MPLSVIELTTVCIQMGTITELPIDALAWHSACNQMALICCKKECPLHGLHQWILIWGSCCQHYKCKLEEPLCNYMHCEERNCLACKPLNEAPLSQQCFCHCSHFFIVQNPFNYSCHCYPSLFWCAFVTATMLYWRISRVSVSVLRVESCSWY